MTRLGNVFLRQEASRAASIFEAGKYGRTTANFSVREKETAERVGHSAVSGQPHLFVYVSFV